MSDRRDRARREVFAAAQRAHEQPYPSLLTAEIDAALARLERVVEAEQPCWRAGWNPIGETAGTRKAWEGDLSAFGATCESWPDNMCPSCTARAALDAEEVTAP